jgi:hypothetical protein
LGNPEKDLGPWVATTRRIFIEAWRLHVESPSEFALATVEEKFRNFLEAVANAGEGVAGVELLTLLGKYRSG